MQAASAPSHARIEDAIIAARALKRRIERAHKMQNRSERSQRVRDYHGAKPDHPAHYTSSVYLPQPRNHAQHERHDRIEASVGNKSSSRGDRRTAVFAVLRTGYDDRLATSRAESRLVELQIRHGR